MNEAGDATVGLFVYILLALWWTFLSALSLFSPDLDMDRKSRQTAKGADAASGNAADHGRNAAGGTNEAFDEKTFLEGAGRAYEMIVTAFAEASLEILRPLLAEDVFESFASETARRNAAGETLEFAFVGVSRAHIEATRREPPALEVDIRFDAQIVRAVRNDDGEVISGAPDDIEMVSDLWTFRREATDRPWLLVATGAS